MAENDPEGHQILRDTLASVGFSAVQAARIALWMLQEVRSGFRDPATPTDVLLAELRSGTTQNTENTYWTNALDAYDKQYRWVRDLISEGALPETGIGGTSPEQVFREYHYQLNQRLKNNGLDTALGSKDRAAEYIGQGVSMSEVDERIGMATDAVKTLPMESVVAFEKYYGIKQNELVSYYLNPELIQKELESRFRTALYGGTAEQSGWDATRNEAETVWKRQLSLDQARQGFASAAASNALGYGYGERLDRSSRFGAAFGEQDALSRAERVVRGRRAGFAAGTGASADTRGVTALGS